MTQNNLLRVAIIDNIKFVIHNYSIIVFMIIIVIMNYKFNMINYSNPQQDVLGHDESPAPRSLVSNLIYSTS